MICIYTGDDHSFCTCSSCGARRDGSADIYRPPFIAILDRGRRRPCPTGIPSSLDGVVPYQPSRCATQCTCCAWCKGEMSDPVGCSCPSPSAPESNCLRGHSALVECRGGCKPKPIAMAIVVEQPSIVERVLRWLFGGA